MLYVYIVYLYLLKVINTYTIIFITYGIHPLTLVLLVLNIRLIFQLLLFTLYTQVLISITCIKYKINISTTTIYLIYTGSYFNYF